MLLIFRRTGERRYGIQAKRPPFPDLEMNPAPGFDPLMPHDMMHAVVEAKLGLMRAVFGQLAAGGDAGTFHPVFDEREKTRDIARVRRRVKAKGKTLSREGHDQSVQSEQAAFVCWNAWRDRTQQKKSSVSTDISDERLNEICRHLDELSSHWSMLKVGEYMTVSWPDLSVSSNVDIPKDRF